MGLPNEGRTTLDSFSFLRDACQSLKTEDAQTRVSTFLELFRCLDSNYPSGYF